MAEKVAPASEESSGEKVEVKGIGQSTGPELLAALIRTGEKKGKSALALGTEIWEAQGGRWEKLLALKEEELAALPGVGQAKAGSLAAAFEVARRAGPPRLAAGVEVRGAADVYAHFKGRFEGLPDVRFFALLMDAKARLLRVEAIGQMVAKGGRLQPKMAFRAAVREAAGSVIFVHTHPVGDPLPNDSEKKLVQRLVAMAKVLDIKVTDHVIISPKGYFSFFETAAKNTKKG